MGKTYELFNKVAKEVVDVQSLNMNQREAERYFRRYKGFEDKQDFKRLYEIRERKHQVESNYIF
jgi:hypothetical protein